MANNCWFRLVLIAKWDLNNKTKYVHLAVCLTTDPKPLPKRTLNRTASDEVLLPLKLIQLCHILNKPQHITGKNKWIIHLFTGLWASWARNCVLRKQACCVDPQVNRVQTDRCRIPKYNAFRKSLCTFKRSWKWCPRTKVSKNWTNPLSQEFSFKF
jgi:hypothetical protein